MMQHGGLGHLLRHGGIAHTANLATVVGDEKFAEPLADPRLHGRSRMPTVEQALNGRRSVERIITVVKGLRQQSAHLLQIALACLADKIDHQIRRAAARESVWTFVYSTVVHI